MADKEQGYKFKPDHSEKQLAPEKDQKFRDGRFLEHQINRAMDRDIKISNARKSSGPSSGPKIKL